MSVLQLFLVVYCTFSSLAALIVVSACAAARRADRIMRVTDQDEVVQIETMALRPQPVVAQRR